MNRVLWTLIVCLWLCGQGAHTREYQAAVIGDFHQNEDYVDNVSARSDCKAEGKHVIYTPDRAPWGRYGCDSPFSLVMSSLTRLKKVLPHPEFILVIGDLVAHGVSCKDESNCDPSQIAKLKRIITNVTKEVTSRFPLTPVLYTVGNTDVIYHNQVPKKKEKVAYYTFLYEVYIKNHPANQPIDNAENRKTFLDGAYYYFDANSLLRVLCLNSLYFFRHNDKHNDPDAADEQLSWLEKQLATLTSHNRRAVLLMHVPKDIDKSDSDIHLWYQKYLDRYNDIMKRYGKVVDVTASGHLHIARHRAHALLVNTKQCDNKKSPYVDIISQLYANISYEQRVENAYQYEGFHTIYIFRAVVPLDLNNPGLSILYFDEKFKSKRIEEHTFDLKKTINSSLKTDGDEYWTRLYDTETDLQLQDLSIEQLVNLHKRMLNLVKVANFIICCGLLTNIAAEELI